MTSLANSSTYGFFPKAFHWLAALCVIVAWLLGDLGDDLPKSAEATGLFVHMSLGLAVLALLVLRLAWRASSPIPALQTRFSPWSDYLATLVHWLLYALMVAVPVAGIALQFARGKALPVFGLLEVASPWAADRAFAHTVKEVHETLANALVIVAAVHVAAALFHHFILRDQTLLRMLPAHRRLQRPNR